MRPLTKEETTLVLGKLHKIIGDNISQLVGKKGEDRHVFRLQRERLYYVSEKLLKKAGSVPRKYLSGLGVLVGKFTKSRKFHIGITFLPHIARYAKRKVWVRPAGEQSYLYGNSVIRRHLGRITEGCDKNSGVVVFSMNDLPLGFGVTTRSTIDMRAAETEAVVVINQGDVGEYLRHECDIV